MLVSSQLSIVSYQWQKTRDKYSFSWLDLFERMNQIRMYNFGSKMGRLNLGKAETPDRKTYSPAE